jgi:hypothetical protein
MGEQTLLLVITAALSVFNTVLLLYLCWAKFTGRMTLTFTKRKSCKKYP